MIACFVVFRASGSGGFVGLAGFVGFGPGWGGVVEVGACGTVEAWGDCFPRRQRETGMNDDAAEA